MSVHACMVCITRYELCMTCIQCHNNYGTQIIIIRACADFSQVHSSIIESASKVPFRAELHSRVEKFKILLWNVLMAPIIMGFVVSQKIRNWIHGI